MAGSVDYVNLHILVHNRGILGQYRDSPFALQGIGVHDQIANFLVDPEYLTLLEQRVYQGSLAVVDVGDYGQIAYANKICLGVLSNRSSCPFGKCPSRVSNCVESEDKFESRMRMAGPNYVSTTNHNIFNRLFCRSQPTQLP